MTPGESVTIVHTGSTWGVMQDEYLGVVERVTPSGQKVVRIVSDDGLNGRRVRFDRDGYEFGTTHRKGSFWAVRGVA